MTYNRSRSVAPKRYQAPRRRSYAKAPAKKRRMPSSGRSFKGANVQIKHFPSPVLSFENMLSQITPGITDDQRIGDHLYVSRMKARLFFTALAAHPALSYRVIVYLTPNSLPTSTGEPTVLDSNVDAIRGYNHLLRSVDGRSNHVLFEKLISPNQMGGLVGTTTSYIEEINGRGL